VENLENAAVLFGLINIVLVVLRSLWNYPFGIAMVSLYFFIFAHEKLYSDALLQIFFLVVQLYGWWYWLRNRDQTGEVIVRSLPRSAAALWLLGIAAATLLWGWMMHSFTDAAFPWWDASVAMISVGAQILLSRRYIENWALWVLVDAVAMGLYHAKGLDKTALLYGVFLLVSVWGWREWMKVGKAQQVAGTPATA
jgi:nicotinamide mononucleotide transporter